MLIFVHEIANSGRYQAELEDGTVLVKSSREPLLASARVLQRRGVPPDTELIMVRRSTGEQSIRGKLGKLAKLTVKNDHTRFVRWEPPPSFKV